MKLVGGWYMGQCLPNCLGCLAPPSVLLPILIPGAHLHICKEWPQQTSLTRTGLWHHQWSLVIQMLIPSSCSAWITTYIRKQWPQQTEKPSTLVRVCGLPRCPAATECEGPPQRRQKDNPAPVPPESKRKSAASHTVVVVRARRPVVRK